MTTASPALIAQIAAESDPAAPILLLGVSGKMGPSLAVLLKRAGAKRVIGVARFSDESQKKYLDDHGVETISADLLAQGALAALPSAPTGEKAQAPRRLACDFWVASEGLYCSVFLMAGFKFGASSDENAGLTCKYCTQFPSEFKRKHDPIPWSTLSTQAACRCL
jgi:hypothetical protein